MTQWSMPLIPIALPPSLPRVGGGLAHGLQVCDIHSRHADQLRQVLDGLYLLQHRTHQGLAVGVFGVVLGGALKAVVISADTMQTSAVSTVVERVDCPGESNRTRGSPTISRTPAKNCAGGPQP